MKLHGETDQEKKERKKMEEKRRKNAAKVTWVNFILDLAGGDPLKFEEASRMPISLALSLKLLVRNREEEKARASRK